MFRYPRVARDGQRGEGVATSVEERMFIRPDGKEKVTGAGRYTADLMLAGTAARAVSLRRSCTGEDPPDRRVARAGAARACSPS